MWQIPRIKATRISVDGCQFGQMVGASIQHQCDTVDGSSGSPLQLRTSGEIAGLHVKGCVSDNGTINCINIARGIDEIAREVTRLKSDLRTVFPTQAPELLAAFHVPQ
jgi:V8-like Glu-specific endopeptidase